MDNKFKTRTERLNQTEIIRQKQIEKEKELERKRDELKKVLFEEEKKKEKKKQKKKPTLAALGLSLMLIASLAFSIFLILDSEKRVNELYEIINAALILLISISIIISFKKAFFKNKTRHYAITSILIITAFTFNALYLFGIIKLPVQDNIPDFTNKSFDKLYEYTESKNINLTQNFEYSDETKKYNVITQSIKPKTLTKNINDLSVTVSNGPDYNKEVIIPDMTGWDVKELLKFVEKNKLKNVQITFEENEEKNGKIISQSNTGKIKRNDSIIFTASLGTKENLKSIKLKNLKNKKLLNTLVSLERHGIIYELTYDFSDKVEKGKIIKTDKKIGTTLKPDDKIVITVSKGKQIKIPELKNKSLKEITKWIIKNKLNLEYEDKYDDSVKKDLAIESNYQKGSIVEEDTVIKVIFSKGKLKMPKFSNLESFKVWASTYNINYEIKEEFNTEIKENEIIKFSIKTGQIIKKDEKILVYVSKGIAIKVPDFIGKTKKEIIKICSEKGLTCSFVNTLSNKTEGTAISQSIAKDSEISKSENINIEIATKKQSEVTKKQSTNNNSHQTNNQSGNQNNNQTPETPTCNTVTIQLNGSEVSPNNPGGTCSNLKRTYGDAIRCSYVTSDEATDGFIINANEIRNKEASNCNPITVKIVKNN